MSIRFRIPGSHLLWLTFPGHSAIFRLSSHYDLTLQPLCGSACGIIQADPCSIRCRRKRMPDTVKYADPLGNGGYYWPACWNKCYRRTAIGNSRFSDIRDGTADVQFFSQMFNKGLRIATWNMPMYYYNYYREGSISEQTGPDWRRYT